MNHGEVIARHVPELHLVDVQILLPPVRPKVGAVFQQEEGVAFRIRLWLGIGGQVAHAVLAPNCHHLGAFVFGNRSGIVFAESRDRGGKVGKKPLWNLLAVALAEQAD